MSRFQGDSVEIVKETMERFPIDFNQAIRAEVDALRDRKRHEWKAQRRQQIYNQAVHSTFLQEPSVTFPFSRGQYVWNAEVFRELVVEHGRDIDIFVSFGHNGDNLLPLDRWNELQSLDKSLSHAYAKMRLQK
uniref:Uncharacterized protein n=1 Tax=viral metagenome TaxID=1070528 RepID=A0A6C0BM04_9ZZZZ